MTLDAWITVLAVAAMCVALVRNVAGPDVILLGTLALLVVLDAFTPLQFISPGEAVHGFGNEGLITVALLFVVVAGLVQTGAMNLLVQPLLGKPRGVTRAQTRLMLPVAVLSAFLNNTPIVAMFMPVVSEWCRKTRISPSKLFIPLSYASILGGTCTLIGTSTNLVVNGLLIEHPQYDGLALFELAWVGLPAAVLGLSYILVVSRWLLPERRSAAGLGDDPRQYTVEMLVEPGSPLAGQTIEQAGLRHLPGLYLVEIERADRVLPAVGPGEILHAGDRLVFVGAVESVVDLRKMRGLTPATDQVFKLDAPATRRVLIEAVVSDRCPLIGKTIREGRFRTVYNAAVIAVARGGERVPGKLGDIRLQPGDTLLLEAGDTFVEQQYNNRDFFLVSAIEGSTPPRHERAWPALAIMIGMVLLAASGYVSMLTAALAAAVGMLLLRCCTGAEARRTVDWSVLIVIGCAFGIGRAVEQSGAAENIARGLLALAGGHPWLSLACVYAVTMVFTAFLTNNAAAVLMFPIAHAAAVELDVNFILFAVAIMLAASNDFSTPIGYQTNLMVYGPGGYRFTDYLRIGLPLNLIVMAVTLLITPLVWPM